MEQQQFSALNHGKSRECRYSINLYSNYCVPFEVNNVAKHPYNVTKMSVNGVSTTFRLAWRKMHGLYGDIQPLLTDQPPFYPYMVARISLL
jgi:hypothetical protein